MTGLAILGAGSLGKLVADIQTARGEEDDIEGFYDDEKTGEYLGYDILGTLDDVDEMERKIIAIGDIDTRKELYDRFKDKEMMFEVAIHPHSVLSAGAPIYLGVGSIVKGGAVIEPEAYIGANCIIGNNSTVCHDTRLGNHCRISPGVTICGNAEIGEEVYLCPGVTVDKDIKIANNTTIMSGTTVYKDIESEGQTIKQSDLSKENL